MLVTRTYLEILFFRLIATDMNIAIVPTSGTRILRKTVCCQYWVKPPSTNSLISLWLAKSKPSYTLFDVRVLRVLVIFAYGYVSVLGKRPWQVQYNNRAIVRKYARSSANVSDPAPCCGGTAISRRRLKIIHNQISVHARGNTSWTFRERERERGDTCARIEIKFLVNRSNTLRLNAYIRRHKKTCWYECIRLKKIIDTMCDIARKPVG